MKRRLLKPPSGHGEILFLPGVEEFTDALELSGPVVTCHQLQFFHPGIGIRFHLVDLLRRENKSIVFMDTDRTDLRVRIPCFQGSGPKVFDFTVSEKPLYTFSSLKAERVEMFFRQIEDDLKDDFEEDSCHIRQGYERFRDIFLTQDQTLSLKDRLADAFLRFSGITARHIFLSQLLGGEGYREFLGRIYGEADRFRAIYNQSIDRFGEVFRFRYQNYPFPKLKMGELPFWVIRDGKRHQFSTDRIDASDLSRYTVVPKASPLTLFLRLHVSALFIHGLGGANYEWVNEYIIERFYQEEAPPYFALSATFHHCGIPERNYAYFLTEPDEIRSTLKDYFRDRGSTIL